MVSAITVLQDRVDILEKKVALLERSALTIEEINEATRGKIIIRSSD